MGTKEILNNVRYKKNLCDNTGYKVIVHMVSMIILLPSNSLLSTYEGKHLTIESVILFIYHSSYLWELIFFYKVNNNDDPNKCSLRHVILHLLILIGTTI